MNVAALVSLILAVIAGVASFIIGAMVWFSERKNQLRIVFLWLAFFVAFWIIGNVVYLSGPVDARYTVALMCYTAAAFVVVTTVVFAMKLVRHQPNRSELLILSLGYVVGVMVAIPGAVAMGINGITIVTWPAGIISYAVIITGFLIWACSILIINLKTAGKILRHQIQLILYGLVAASLIGLTFNLLLPIFGQYHFTQLGPAGATVFIVYIAYSIARYSLFDVRLAIVRGVAYVATFATLVGFYIALATLIAAIFNGAMFTPHQMIFNIVTALIMAVLLPPIKRFFDKLTDKVFYRDNYNTDEFYAHLNKILARTSDLRALLEQSSQLIARTFKTNQAFFFIYVDETHHVSAGTEDHARLTLDDVQLLDEAVRSNNGRFFLETQMDSDNHVRRLMISHRVSLIVPLYRNHVVVGYLFLGERQGGNYTRRDLKVLGTIANELGIAVQNAQSVQEVRELNASLEQRINVATRELRASNTQLQHLDEVKDEFISMASHQLRTPLTSIKGYLSMLIEGDVGEVTKEQKHLLSEAFVSSERMVRLIGDFLNVSRLQTGKFVIDKRPVDLAQLIEREIEGLGPNASARGITFTYKKPKNIPILELDENKIEQVIMNFADNAIYYSKNEGKVVMTLKKAGDYVEFKVIDHGIGVPKEEQGKLFTKFFRAANARKARPDGTGVGLFLAKKVIDDHGGSIVFESEEGKGSTFGFRLPLPKAPSSKEKPSE
ncbi:MAG TPA: ATP-binding protein [Dongiaceae bacterium]|nr:ATP-binding protein [Dongiaceae bacterium]